MSTTLAGMFYQLFLSLKQPLECIDISYVTRKKKPSLSEQFKDIPVKQFVVNTLSDEEKECSVCSAVMQPIGTEVIRREVVHVKPEMYMIEYVATTYGCPVCKDTEAPQFIRDDRAPKAFAHSTICGLALSLSGMTGLQRL